jgi:hypothetical protein
MVFSVAGLAAEPVDIPEMSSGEAEVWLVTFGPGEIYWERFGHNAIWLRDPAAGLDHTFNFGYFDFEQEDFFSRFLRGRMLYFSIAQPAMREFEYYSQHNRSIRTQKLDIGAEQFERIRDYLLNEIKPENRDYRYDYYLSNCSTRIRDVLDMAYDGALSSHAGAMPATLNFRDQTRRLTQMQFWYYLGLEIALGLPVDREVTRWDEMFIPMVLADELAAVTDAGGFQGQRPVLIDTMVFTPTSGGVPQTPGLTWYRYLLLGLLLTGLAWLSSRFMPPPWLAGICQGWVLINASIGTVLAALWFLTDHQVAGPNANLLLLNPLVMLALVPALKKIAGLIMGAGVLVCLMLLLLPLHQHNHDVLALLAPLNLAVALFLLCSGSKENQLAGT